MPRLYSNGKETYQQDSQFWLYDCSYLRLKNLSINYTLPKSITSKISADQIAFFFLGTNLITWSKFKDYDPAQASVSSYPMVKTFTLGLTVTF